MTLSLSQKIQALYPELNSPEAWDGIVIENTLESNGDYIASWNHATLNRPTEEQLNSIDGDSYLNAIRKKVADELRSSAYQKESDPLFFKAQRGEATIEEWQAKVAEIKARFPK